MPNNDSGEDAASNKRMRPETAALQLLELSGQTTAKRSRTETILGDETVTNGNDEATQNPLPPDGGGGQGQFDDASSETEDKSARTGKGEPQSESITIAKSSKAFDLSAQDGQFDDASEEDVPDIPLLWKSQREQNQPPKNAPAPAPVPPRQQQVLPLQVSMSRLTYPLATSRAMWNPTPGFQLIAPAPHPNFHPIPIAPRPAQQRQITFADGPLAVHPNPLLEPEAKVDESLRLRPMPPVTADTEHRRFPVYKPLPTDILLGRGGRSNHHAGNEWFREFVQLYRPTYHRVEKFDKMQLATNLVNYVRHCGGRFLQKVKTPTTPQVTVWFEVGDVRAREKCSQCLREAAPDASKPAAAAAAPKPEGKNAAPQKKASSRKSSSIGNNKRTTSANSTSTSQSPRTAASRRPSTTSTITTTATETDVLIYDEEDPSSDNLGVLTI